MNLDDSLRDKLTPFEDIAQLSQALKFAMRRGRHWEALPPESKEALEMISAHTAMILSGDFTEAQHWNNIATYARMRGKTLEQTNLESSVSRLARIRTQALASVEDEPA